jgi:hypothetical protein
MGFLVVLLLCLCDAVSAQSPSPQETLDLTIVKHSWTKERINWEGDPFGGPVETFDDMRRRRVDERRVERARGSGNIAEAAKVEREMRSEQVIKARPPSPPRYAFLYKVSLRNNTKKTIKAIDWDYIFFSSDTQSEAGRREFTSEEGIAPGKTRELKIFTPHPPTKTISVNALNKNERAGLEETVVIVRVTYADGSVWERP